MGLEFSLTRSWTGAGFSHTLHCRLCRNHLLARLAWICAVLRQWPRTPEHLVATFYGHTKNQSELRMDLSLTTCHSDTQYHCPASGPVPPSATPLYLSSAHPASVPGELSSHSGELPAVFLVRGTTLLPAALQQEA